MAKTKKEKAVALKYNAQGDSAPVVIASGYGHMAQKIIEIAETQGIPVFRDESAASLLCMLEVGRQIPPELYEVIAAVYASILRISGELKHTSGPQDGSADSSVAAARIQEHLEKRRQQVEAARRASMEMSAEEELLEAQ